MYRFRCRAYFLNVVVVVVHLNNHIASTLEYPRVLPSVLLLGVNALMRFFLFFQFEMERYSMHIKLMIVNP